MLDLVVDSFDREYSSKTVWQHVSNSAHASFAKDILTMGQRILHSSSLLTAIREAAHTMTRDAFFTHD